MRLGTSCQTYDLVLLNAFALLGLVLAIYKIVLT